MSYDIYWTPTRCKKFSTAWANELNDIQPEVVVQFVCKHTGMEHVTSRRQLMNGTLMFFDREFNEHYALYIRSGYVRRASSASHYGPHRIGDTNWAWYQLNPQRRVDKYRGTIRITFPNDAHELAQRLIRAYKVRHKRNYVNDRGNVWPLRKVDWGKKKPRTIEDSMM